MYARVVVSPARRNFVAPFALMFMLACSAPSGADQRVELCADLLNLEPTVELVVAPSLDLKVGDLRAGLDKMSPTLERVNGSTVVPEPEKEDLQEAHADYKSVIHGISDDAPLADVRYTVAVPGGRLGALYRSLVERLACAQAPARP